MVTIQEMQYKQHILRSLLREEPRLISEKLKRNEALLAIGDLRGLIREMTRAGSGVKRIDAVRYEIARREKTP